MDTQARPMPKSTREVLSYEHERVLERYASDYKVTPDVARARFVAFKEFMIVCAMMPGPKVTSAEIDSMWHSFLLFTKDYRAFCMDYLGRFINHEPFERPNAGAYLETRAFAERLFGPLDPSLWPPQAKGDCSSGCDD